MAAAAAKVDSPSDSDTGNAPRGWYPGKNIDKVRGWAKGQKKGQPQEQQDPEGSAGSFDGSAPAYSTISEESTTPNIAAIPEEEGPVQRLRRETEEQAKALFSGSSMPNILLVDAALEAVLPLSFLESIWPEQIIRQLSPRLELQDIFPVGEMDYIGTLSVAFIVRPTITAIVHVERLAYDIIRVYRSMQQSINHGKGPQKPVVCFISNMSLVCKELLGTRGLLPHLELRTREVNPLHQIDPLDNHLLSLEYGRFFRDCFVDKDISPLPVVAHAIRTLDRIFGGIRCITAIGLLSQEALDIASLAMPDQRSAREPPGVDRMVIIDRTVDMVSPLVTPSTYEGLMEEFPRESVAGRAASSDETSQDAALTRSLQRELRDLSINAVRATLAQKSREVSETFEQMRSPDKKKASFEDRKKVVQSMKQFALDGGYDAMKIHMDSAQELFSLSNTPDFLERLDAEQAMLRGETCLDFLEDVIATQQPQVNVLRLLCLQYLLAPNPLNKKQYDFHRTEMIQTYGYEMLFTFDNLEKVGLVGTKQTLDWRQLRRAFSLLKPKGAGAAKKRLMRVGRDTREEEDVRQDLSAAFKGYTPLSVKIVQAVVSPQWPMFADLIKDCNAVDASCNLDDQFLHRKASAADQSSPSVDGEARASFDPSSKKELVVFFVGGVTKPELSVLRTLSNRDDFPYRITCCTTNVASGSEMLIDCLVVFPKERAKEFPTAVDEGPVVGDTPAASP